MMHGVLLLLPQGGEVKYLILMGNQISFNLQRHCEDCEQSVAGRGNPPIVIARSHAVAIGEGGRRGNLCIFSDSPTKDAKGSFKNTWIASSRQVLSTWRSSQ
jgi:hypothetical protein